MKRAVEQVIGREDETATFFSRCLLTFSGLGGSFAPVNSVVLFVYQPNSF